MNHNLLISINSAKELIEREQALILDMRDIKSYLSGHYPTAMHLSCTNLRALLKTTRKDLPIIIGCYHGHKSLDMAQLFTDFGFSQCFSLEGGFDAWFEHIQYPESELPLKLQDWLLKHGYDIHNLDARKTQNETALMLAAKQSNDWVCEKLLEAGATTNLVNTDGNNALWLASIQDATKIIDLLLAHNIDVNNQNDYGATALLYAASIGNHTLVQTLLTHGADPKLTTHDGFNALDVASNTRTLRLLRDYFAASWGVAGAVA